MMKHIPRKVKDKYEILGVIGEGAYGVVLKAQAKESDQVVAIKYFKQTPGYNSDSDVIERELKILQSLRFENVVELIEWFGDKKRCFLIFEYVDSNMLAVLQDHPKGLPLDEVRQLSYQLFSAIHWCHTHDIIHRDIKPENLLISKNFILKLCDFGFARFCNTQTSADYYTNYVATRWYRSPELLIGSAYGKPVDIWACGCIMAEFATGQALFAGESDIDQLYRIQKNLGSLPMKYLEDMIRNPKFEGLKFPVINHIEPLESQFNQIFPADMLHLFKNTLKLCAADRFTAEQCIQHDSFYYLNQKRSQLRTKTALNISQSQSDILSQAEKRLSRSYDETNLIPTRQRSSSTNNKTNVDDNSDLSFASTSFTAEKPNYRSSNALPNRSVSFTQHRPKIIRTRTKTYSSFKDEEDKSSLFVSGPSNDNIEGNTNLLRKTYLQNHQSTSSIREQSSSTLRHASNEVLLRPKLQQQTLTNLTQSLSKDSTKRLSLDQYQLTSNNPNQTDESYVYRSSMIIVPEPTREEPVNDSHLSLSKIRENKRDLFRSHSVHHHSSSNTKPNFSRTSSRQTRYQTVCDLVDDVDTDSAVSLSYQGNRSFEQQPNNIYSRNSEQRRRIYGSDSHLTNSSGYNSSFNRSSLSSMKNDYIHINKNTVIPQQDLNSSMKLSTKSNSIVQPKTSNESNRRQESNNGIFGVYPLARTAMKHVTSALLSSSHSRSTSLRNSNRKSQTDDV
ncbi:hypothetical protein I4U23_024260 [Adineta vaga]|nr:hypothetical protein I4U23_024260 [Adineta vaga]